MDNNIIAALFGLLGISLGSFLAGIGYYLTSRRMRLHSKRNVLFHLLEIRHQIKTSYFNPQEITDEYFNHCAEHFKKVGLATDEKVPVEISELIKGHIQSLINAFRPNIDSGFLQSFEESLKLLCIDDPVLAYKLRGREKLVEVLDAQENYIDNFNCMKLLKDSSVLEDVISKQLNKANDSATKELIEDIDKDISLISRKCGIASWWGCMKIIKNTSKPTLEFERLGLIRC